MENEIKLSDPEIAPPESAPEAEPTETPVSADPAADDSISFDPSTLFQDLVQHQMKHIEQMQSLVDKARLEAQELSAHCDALREFMGTRSEEHTSELQSQR